MEKSTKVGGHEPHTPNTRPSVKTAFLLAPLLAFLALYNFVPDVHDKVQSFFAIPSLSDPRIQVQLKQGTYLGQVLPEANRPVPIEAFLGIPYALPPVGERRFARPVPVPESNETFQATEYSLRCPGKQLLRAPGAPWLEASEDCLTLNVFRWRNGFSFQKKLPVLVYIHGGAFNRGFAAMHDTASMLAWSEEPFIALSFNYRIGALGFLNSELTAKEGLLNVGLHDQKLVLEWVQENIGAFGGDPNDVTIAGLSAGAHSIGHHIMDVNEKRTLFHKAIIESGGATSRAVHPADSKLHKAQFDRFVAEVGCGKAPESEILACLREASSEAVTTAQTAVFDEYNPSVRWAWQPVLDDDIISRRPLDAWKSGKWHKVPVLTGFNHNEGTMYVPKKLQKSDEFTGFFATLLPQLTKSDVKKLDALYPNPAKDDSSPYVDTRDLGSLGIGEQFKRVEAAYGHYAYVCPVRQTAEYGTQDGEQPVFLYHWAVNKTLLGGANHGDQIHYEAMSPLARAVSPTHDQIARWFNSYLTSFIVTGNPNTLRGRAGFDRPAWSPYAVDKQTMIFGAGNDEAAGGDHAGIAAGYLPDAWAREECDFWWQKSEVPED
ncbi:carboxylesterase family [Lecanosticta acicola]|uniref:Carboxylic ester hydrolase n=1 Tax=Lecanosticta acicola TaxID=111012 RepID=A0AAI8YVQ0_9PEZI|nr:carboxylesterase family [Lecanosticta acicola]